MAGRPAGYKNRSKAAAWTDQLKWALENYEDLREGVAQGQALRKIAMGVVKDALDREAHHRWDAIQEIGNRLEGRPAQAVTVDGDGEGGPVRHALEVLFVEAASQISREAAITVSPVSL